MENDRKIKNKFFSVTTLLKFLLVISVCVFCVAVYVNSHPELIRKQPTTTDTTASSNTEASPEPSASALPSNLTDPNSVTVLVDKQHSLSRDFVPTNLATPYLQSTVDVIQIRQDAGDAAKSMIAAADAAGIKLYVTAGYRSYDEQQTLYEDRVSRLGESQAEETTAKAGYSENQTGLALDFTDTPTGTSSTDFANTPAGQWLYANAHTYGFILRYPENKQSITGYAYMPWHYRFVGTDVSTAMYEQGGTDLTFEEFFQVTK
ncbi:MAG: M15 family metallopeptidase [Erysipelotrichaceae bacterium]|nr:M15 family metallopeptidase [Erysipelotrichaceae bacterium]MDY6034126.1 M15 family metallopeptidase [Bulleidia sp.]